MTWYVVRSATRQEQRAVTSLSEAGFEAYFPKVTRLERLHRQKTREVKHRPLLTGYLFVHVHNGDFRSVEAADGVHALLRFVNVDGMLRPRPVQDSLIDAYRTAEDAGAFDERFKIGARGRVTKGPWCDHIAEIVELCGDHRVKVFLELFGRMNKVELDVADLEPA